MNTLSLLLLLLENNFISLQSSKMERPTFNRDIIQGAIDALQEELDRVDGLRDEVRVPLFVP